MLRQAWESRLSPDPLEFHRRSLAFWGNPREARDCSDGLSSSPVSSQNMASYDHQSRHRHPLGCSQALWRATRAHRRR
jgi:hypothetical protein